MSFQFAIDSPSSQSKFHSKTTSGQHPSQRNGLGQAAHGVEVMSRGGLDDSLEPKDFSRGGQGGSVTKSSTN